MSKIKSALELALERTAGITVDKEALRKENITRQGKTAAGQYLSEPESVSLKEQTDALKNEEKTWFREGVVETLLANLSLPRYENEMERLPLITQALKDLADKRKPDRSNLEYLLNQIEELFRQFIQNLDDLEKQLALQWESRLRQKEELLRQQTGRSVHLTPEQDPEYLKTLSEEMARIEAQYTEVLTQGKNELRNLLG